MTESFLQTLIRKTCGAFLIRSGAVKDQLGLLSQVWQPALEVGQADGPLKVIFEKFFITVIGAYEQDVS
jgi:hypothetical protein